MTENVEVKPRTRFQFGLRTLAILLTLFCLIMAAWVASTRTPSIEATGSASDGNVVRGTFHVYMSQTEGNTTSHFEKANIVEIHFYPTYVVLVSRTGDGSLYQVDQLSNFRWRSVQ